MHALVVTGIEIAPYYVAIAVNIAPNAPTNFVMNVNFVPSAPDFLIAVEPV